MYQPKHVERDKNENNSNGGVGKSMQINDQRLSTSLQLKQQQIMRNNVLPYDISDMQTSVKPTLQAKPIQLYSYGPSTTRSVTVTGNSKTKTFEECTFNSVEFLAGEKKPSTGTATNTPASWAGWLTNKKGGNNATQLHVVNRRWGGLGGQADKNIVPGTPAENSHHLHQAEKEFDKCFNSSDKAINNCKYECSVAPKYGTAVNVTGGNVDYGDPTINVSITNAGVKTSHPVADGVDGLTFKEGN